MEHAIIGFFERLRLILMAAGIMGFLAYTALLIAQSALMLEFRDLDPATRRIDLFTNFIWAILPVCLITISPVLLGIKPKSVEIGMFGAVGGVDLCLWLFIRQRYHALTPMEQGEWKAILPPVKLSDANRVIQTLACIPLVLFL